MFYRQIENEIFSKILDHSGGGFSSGHRWGILGGRQGLVRFESFEEGKAAQTLHIGPFSEEGPTIEKVHNFITESGFKLSGKHHEIYLSDIRKAAPEKWKTIIRQPIKK